MDKQLQGVRHSGNVLCHEITFSEMIKVWRSVVRSGIRYGREESGLEGIMGHHKGRKKSDVDCDGGKIMR